MNLTQKKRLAWRSAFFALFLLAPVLDVFRYDLYQNHFILLGQSWRLGIDGGQSPLTLAWNMLTRFFLPLFIVAGTGIYVSWKWGRLYCGWLCPHFSVVEIINSLMRHASGKLSIWDKMPLPNHQRDGKHINPKHGWWLITASAVVFFAALWSVVLLTYLLPPKEIYSNLLSGTLSRNQSIFIIVATLLLIIEFTLARHLFCRFGCAIGVFQSLVWMGNKKAMVVAFDRKRTPICADCDQSCEHACPMRLKPRSIKRKMFTCTQCMQCIQACGNVQAGTANPPLLKMLEYDCALDVSDRGFGSRPTIPQSCFGAENPHKRRCKH